MFVTPDIVNVYRCRCCLGYNIARHSMWDGQNTMVKNLKSLFVGSLAIAGGGGAFIVSRRYHRWLQQQRVRLTAGSQMLETSKGLLEYQMLGSGPVVLVLHGSPGGYDGGLSFAQVLGLDNCTLLSVSRPGYLRTPLSSGPSPEDQADLYAAALDALAIPQVVVAALSGGGPSGLQFALRHPDRCRALTLFSALSQHYSEEGALAALPWFKRQFVRLGDKFIFWNPAVFVLDTLSSMGPPENPARHIIQSMAMGQSRRDGNDNDMHQFARLPTFPGQRSRCRH